MSGAIACFVRALHGGGAQRAMVRLASGLAELGHPVTLLTLDPEGPFRRELSLAVTLVPLPARRLLTALPALVHYLARQRPAVLFTTEPACNIALIAARALARSPSRLVIRESLFPSLAARHSPHSATRLAYRLARLAYPHADAIVALTPAMAQDLARLTRLDPPRISLIPLNPVVTPALLAAGQAAPDHPWFADPVPIILGVGRLEAQKDFATLLAAFELVRARRPCRLLLYGDGPLRPALEHQRAASRFAADIALPGFHPAPYAAMARCAAFVLSSRYEGLPNALIEALACGAPVVACDCPSGPREVLGDGRYGRLVPVGDAEAMAAAIRLTLDDPIDRAISSARGREYTIAASAALYAQVLLPGAVP
jgi:glycosyltransferase involved in cell wall biosynthesis